MPPRRPLRLAARLGLALAVAAFAAAGAQSPPADSTEVVRRFVDAFNARELDALLALAHPEVEWLSISGSQVAVETRGREALGESLRGYFTSCPSCRSTVEIYQVVGTYVSALEHAEWDKDGARLRQSSLSIYEIVDGLVRRVWYYPAVRAMPGDADG